MTDVKAPAQETKIKVIGIGHGGNDALGQLVECAVPGVELIYVHASTQALPHSRAHRRLGDDAAPAAMRDILAAIADTKLLFITAATDDIADTQAAIAVARTAREMRIVTVGLAAASCEPSALAELKTHVDSLIVAQASNPHGLFKNVVSEIAAILNEYGCVNVDITDVGTVLREPGRVVMGLAQAGSPDRARIAAAQAIDGLPLAHAKAMLVLVTAAKGSLKLSESRLAMRAISACSSPTIYVIFGVARDDALGDSVRVSVLATGLSR